MNECARTNICQEPTHPDPSQEGSRHSSAPCQFPSEEGLGVGSWSQCMQTNERRLAMPKVVF